MHVIERCGVSSAAACRGHVVVIDVLRAFTTAAYALAAGADAVIPVGTVGEARALRAEDPRIVLAGEVGGRRIEGFEFSNSPAEIGAADLAGRTVVIRTGSGTQGAVRATGADALCLGSLPVAAATVRYLRSTGAELVTLLASASTHGPDGPEDVACSAYLAGLLHGEPTPFEETIRRVRASPAAAQALDPAIDWISPEDLDCATAVDRFDFAMPVTRESGLLVARRVSA